MAANNEKRLFLAKKLTTESPGQHLFLRCWFADWFCSIYQYILATKKRLKLSNGLFLV